MKTPTLSIAHQIFVGILLTGFLVTAALGVLIFNNIQNGYTHYILRAELGRMRVLLPLLSEEYDAEAKAWPRLTDSSDTWQGWIAANTVPDHIRGMDIGEGPSDRSPLPGASLGAALPDPMRLAWRIFLMDADQNVLVGTNESGPYYIAEPISVDVDGTSTVVGWLGVVAPERPFFAVFDGRPSPGEEIFWASLSRSFLLAVAVAIILSLISAVFLSRRIVRPLQALAQGARNMAHGDYEHKIPTNRTDEVGQLVAHYNTLAVSLEDARQAERQFMSDTSHELQTPVAVLLAEIEAIRDGIRQATPENLEEMRLSVLRLTNLIKDLQVLAYSREGRFKLSSDLVDLGDIAQSICAVYEARAQAAGVDIICHGPTGTVISGDAHRLSQVFNNLIENAIRYTDAPGKVVVDIKDQGDKITVTVEDTPPAAPSELLATMFDRFKRGEASRSRSYGGSGLGLAISKAIVGAHAGTISAGPSELGGVAIVITFPKAQ
ncbi:MAG: ATP-binding protein [Maritimibacter sp.]